tara:strand:+ start:1405 stop:2217 length:813 start_codon:yes stop_codon:yes gene_type:complete
MKIGVTGSTGIIGTEIKKIFKLKNRNLFIDKIENKKKVIDWIKLNNFDVIIHLAAVVPTTVVNNNKNKSLMINFGGTKNLVNAINLYSKKRIWLFYSSTSHVYSYKKTKNNEKNKTKPISYYGKTKLKGEKYILNNCKKFIPCIGRIFSFTSKNQKKLFIIPSLISKLKNKNKKIIFDNINHERDFLTLKDIIHAIKLLKNKKAKGVYNICSGKKINLKDILFALNNKYKKKIIIKDNNKTILFGSNKKLLKLGWKLQNNNYLNYLKKNY